MTLNPKVSFDTLGKELGLFGVMYQSIPSLTIPPRAKPRGNFFDGRISHPPGKKGVQNPHPRAYKNELKPHPGAFFSIIQYKNMKKLDRNHVKL